MTSPSDWQLKSTGGIAAVLEADKGTVFGHIDE